MVLHGSNIGQDLIIVAGSIAIGFVPPCEILGGMPVIKINDKDSAS